MKNTINDIRKKWIDYFISKKHLFIERSNLVPKNDDSILFINSGIATLKDYFIGKANPPSKRLVNVQPVIRTGDIDKVGKTSRHHTFFEMLGNFSINDYFKKEAIEYAYEFLTSKKQLAINKSLLYITVFENDEETIKIWENLGIKEDHIFKMGRKTNFWDLGIGPCGPSTEIFFDRGKKYSNKNAKELIGKNIENDRYIEIWNIVFSEFNNDGAGNYTKLPQKNIDTGAGIERIACCLQETPTNFETDAFSNLIKHLEKLTKIKYKWDYIPNQLIDNDYEQFKINSYYKGIVDFIRTIVFAISDGVKPGPNGREYVIRRLVRKSILYAHNLKIEGLFLTKLVDDFIDSLKDAYKDIEKKSKEVKKVIMQEEEKFHKNLSRAFDLFKKEDLERIDEKKAFMYYETYGLPLEFIYDFLEENNIKIDKNKIREYYNQFKNKSRSNKKQTLAFKNQNDLFLNEKVTNFLGYETLKSTAKVLGIEGEFVAFDQTPFYATSGGQIYDIGLANDFEVVEVKKNINNVFIHKILNHNFQIGEKVVLQVNEERRAKITAHHSATHLLFSALEIVLDTHLNQVGSKVTEKEFRFDFSYSGNITNKDLKRAVEIVNKWIKTDNKTITSIMPIEEAKKVGATFLENAKYGNEVRVVKLNEQTIDLCGGTHVSRLGLIEKIQIIDFQRKGSDVYRINAIAGEKLINRKITDIRKEKLENYLHGFKKIEDDFRSKMEYFNPQYLINISLIVNTVRKLDIKNPLWEELVAQKKEELNKIAQSTKKEIEFNLKNKMVKYLDEAKEDELFKIEGFSVKELINTSLQLINNHENKILKILVSSNNKISLIFAVGKKQLKSKNLEDNLNKIKQTGLRGSGNRQLYTYGGKVDILNDLYKLYKIWNN